jgi:hypothetical protein
VQSATGVSPVCSARQQERSITVRM